MATAALQPTPMYGWPDGTKHYRTDDGRDFAVIIDDGIPNEIIEMVQPVLDVIFEEDSGGGDYQPPVQPRQRPTFPRASVLVEIRPTVIVPCRPDGTAIDLTPAWSFPPTTSHEDALQLAGFSIA